LVAPHFGIALQAFAEVEARRVEGAILQQMLLRLNFGCLTLDSGLRVRSRDAIAASVLADTDLVAVDAEGRLRLADPDSQASLRMHVAAAAAGRGTRRALRLEGREVLDLLVEPLGAEGESRVGAPVAVLYLRGRTSDTDRTRDPERSARLSELFDLTPSEARLTVSLAQGRSLVEAADRLGISEQTARTYSKRIFSKTRTNRQAELVHKVLTSLVSLG
jgi:DNA-binding CsgD family transcriptional regulator